jgi:hypothetical protein
MLAAVALAVGLGAAAVLAVAGGLFEGRPAGIPDSPPGAASIAEVADYEPFAPSELGDEELLERARDGYAHPLYTIPPGGAVGSAARTARLRPLVEAAARRHDVEPETLEALVLLESTGRPDVAASGDPEGAVGLGQILPGTATGLLQMRVDLAASKRLTARIEREHRRSRRARSARVRRAGLGGSSPSSGAVAPSTRATTRGAR